MYYSNCESIKKNPKNCILKNDGFHGIEPNYSEMKTVKKIKILSVRWKKDKTILQ